MKRAIFEFIVGGLILFAFIQMDKKKEAQQVKMDCYKSQFECLIKENIIGQINVYISIETKETLEEFRRDTKTNHLIGYHKKDYDKDKFKTKKEVVDYISSTN